MRQALSDMTRRMCDELYSNVGQLQFINVGQLQSMLFSKLTCVMCGGSQLIDKM